MIIRKLVKIKKLPASHENPSSPGCLKKIIFAKTYPEKREFLSIYYLCEITGGIEKAGEKFIDLKHGLVFPTPQYYDIPPLLFFLRLWWYMRGLWQG